MRRDNAHLRFLRDPDAEARRAELVAFIGPNPSPFLLQYAKLKERPERPRFDALASFVVMAFFLGPCWFFYRRMWTWGWAIVALTLALGFVPGSSRLGLPLAFALALFGRYAYLSHAFGKIEKLRAGAPTADPDVLRRAGGVSKWAGWTSGVVYLLFCAFALAAMFAVLAGGGDIDELR